jgi:hypothetical protein
VGLAGKSKETTSVLSERICSPPALRHQLSDANPLSNANSLLKGKRTGNFVAFALSILNADTQGLQYG